MFRGRGRSENPRSPRFFPRTESRFLLERGKKMAVWRCLKVGKEVGVSVCVCLGGELFQQVIEQV